MKLFKFILIPFLVMAVIACGGQSQEDTSDAVVFSPEFLKGIETTEVVAQNIEQQLKLTGKVEYDPDRMVCYVPLVSGVVVSTHFNLGDRVSRGQTMAVIRSSELNVLYAERQSLMAEVEIMNRSLESTRSMYNDNLSSEKDLVEAQGKLTQAKAELERVNQTLSGYGATGVDGAFAIKAPIDGFVTERNMAPGVQITTDGGSIFTVADISKVWVTANVYAGNLDFVRPGMAVDIRTLAYPDELFTGKIDIIPQVFDPEEHVLKARIVMPNANLKLKPEMAVDLTLKDSRDVKMACVPSGALIFDNNRYFVVRQDGERFSVAEVKLYAQNNGASYVESGIVQGDRIVVKDQLLMYAKLKG